MLSAPTVRSRRQTPAADAEVPRHVAFVGEVASRVPEKELIIAGAVHRRHEVGGVTIERGGDGDGVRIVAKIEVGSTGPEFRGHMKGIHNRLVGEVV